MTPIFRASILSILLLILPGAASAAAGDVPDPALGRWTAVDGPDTASMILLLPDGRFRYALSVGALDEGAEGRWRREGPVVRLFTEPTPRPPRILIQSMSPSGPAPLTVFVGTANGQGIPGVDFRIEFDSGAAFHAYTQYDGWTADSQDRRVPRWIQLFEPIHRITSERFPIPPGARTLRFTLEANDLGIVDFRGAEVRVEEGNLTLRGPRGEQHYTRVEE